MYRLQRPCASRLGVSASLRKFHFRPRLVSPMPALVCGEFPKARKIARYGESKSISSPSATDHNYNLQLAVFCRRIPETGASSGHRTAFKLFKMENAWFRNRGIVRVERQLISQGRRTKNNDQGWQEAVKKVHCWRRSSQ